MPDSLPRTAHEQLAYWLERGVDKFVYVIKAKDDSPIKVGKAESITTRLAQLQTGNPRELVLKRVLVGYSALEWQLHRKLRRGRLVGEWFDGEPIHDFLKFTEDLAERMLVAHRETGQLPDWREFGDWEKPPSKREIEAIPPKRDEPEIAGPTIKRAEAEIGWMRLCPDCYSTHFTVQSEPDPRAPSWHPGVVRCQSGHAWSYSQIKAFNKRRQEGRFYLIGRA